MANKEKGQKPKRRPTKYKKEYNNIVYKLCLLGKTDAEMSEILGVAESTFHKWKKDYPEFSESITRGKDLADAEVAASLRERALGYSHNEEKVFCSEGRIITHETTKHYPPDTQAAAIWLYNRQPDKWKRQPVVDVDGVAIPEKITVEVMDARKPDAKP